MKNIEKYPKIADALAAYDAYRVANMHRTIWTLWAWLKQEAAPSGRATAREIGVSAEPANPAVPVRRMKNWERFANRHEATAAHAAEKVVFGCGWGEIEWLYMDYIPDEPRIDYLKRLSKLSILKSEGFKELKRLEKAEKAKKEAR